MRLAGVVLREGQLLLRAVRVEDDHADHPARQRRGGFDAVGQTGADGLLLHHKAVNDNVDGVLDVFIQLDFFRQVVHAAVHAHADIAASGRVLEHLLVHTLLRTDDRRQHHKAHAVFQFRKLRDDLIDRLLLDDLAADRTVGYADARVEQAEVIVDFRHGADRRARVLRGRFLVDGDRRRQPLDGIDVRLVKLPEEHPRVGRKRLDEPAVSLRVQRVERQRGLARAGKPRKHDEFVARERERDVFQVMHPRAFDDDVR